MRVAEKIDELIANIPATRLPVIFNGIEPRLLGDIATVDTAAAARPEIDLLLLAARLSAERISLAQSNLSGRVFVVAHA